MIQAININVRNRSMNSGVLALIATILVWAAYFVALRSGAQSSLTHFDMALLRFVLPAIILLPVLIKSRAKIYAVKKRYLLGIMMGAGLPFYFLSVIASANVQAVVGSLLVPGVSPVFVTLIAVVCYKEMLTKRRLIGLSIVLCGISILIYKSLTGLSNVSFIGISLYVVAASCWAIYTISIKLAGLSGLELAAFINASAVVLLILFYPMFAFETNMLNTDIADVLPQLLIMGVFCGLVSVVTYGHAVNKLGAELSACWGAVTPVVVAILAFVTLSETLGIQTIIAMFVIIAGVVLANFRKS
jgi:drug/metabolite transporter (DMT)-like permease